MPGACGRGLPGPARNRGEAAGPPGRARGGAPAPRTALLPARAARAARGGAPSPRRPLGRCACLWDLDNVPVPNRKQDSAGLAGLVGGLAAALGGGGGYVLRGFGNRSTLSAPAWGPGVLDAALDRCEGDWCDEDEEVAAVPVGDTAPLRGGAAQLVAEHGLRVVRVNNEKQRADVHIESEACKWLEAGEGVEGRSLVLVSGDSGFEGLLRRAQSEGVTTVSVQRGRDWHKEHLRLPASGLAAVSDVLIVCAWGMPQALRGPQTLHSNSGVSSSSSLQDLRRKVFELLRRRRGLRKGDLPAAFEEEHGHPLVGGKYGLRKREVREALQGVWLDGELARRQGTTSLSFGGASVAVKPDCLYPDPLYDERALWSLPKNALQSLEEGADSASVWAPFSAGMQCFSTRADELHGRHLRALGYPYQCCLK